jgi:hypothetical protein
MGISQKCEACSACYFREAAIFVPNLFSRSFASLRFSFQIYFAAIGVINNDFFWQCALSNKSDGLAGGFPLQT